MNSLTNTAERSDLASIAILVAEEAATLVSEGYRSRPRVDEKGRHDLVTEFDRASQEMLIARLTSLSPGLPIVGEEQSAVEREAAGRRGLIWYVDPIDGTTNFVHGHPFWSVAVGLMENDQPIVGAVVAPSIGLRWTGWVAPRDAEGAKGMAFRNGKQCQVSSTTTLNDALLSTGFALHTDRSPENNVDAFVAMQRSSQGIRRCGSAAIDICMVADGTYDGHWERRLHSWDTVAASAILLASGGTITALDGSPPDYHIGYLAASNGLLHREMLNALGM